MKHYLRMVNGKPTFSYCTQSKEYLEKKLKRITQKTLSNGKDSLSNNPCSMGLGQNDANPEERYAYIGRLETAPI